MIELRWIVIGDRRELQWRKQTFHENEWGKYFEWNEWQNVPYVVDWKPEETAQT